MSFSLEWVMALFGGATSSSSNGSTGDGKTPPPPPTSSQQPQSYQDLVIRDNFFEQMSRIGYDSDLSPISIIGSTVVNGHPAPLYAFNLKNTSEFNAYTGDWMNPRVRAAMLEYGRTVGYNNNTTGIDFVRNTNLIDIAYQQDLRAVMQNKLAAAKMVKDEAERKEEEKRHAAEQQATISVGQVVVAMSGVTGPDGFHMPGRGMAEWYARFNSMVAAPWTPVWTLGQDIELSEDMAKLVIGMAESVIHKNDPVTAEAVWAAAKQDHVYWLTTQAGDQVKLSRIFSDDRWFVKADELPFLESFVRDQVYAQERFSAQYQAARGEIDAAVTLGNSLLDAAEYRGRTDMSFDPNAEVSDNLLRVQSNVLDAILDYFLKKYGGTVNNPSPGAQTAYSNFLSHYSFATTDVVVTTNNLDAGQTVLKDTAGLRAALSSLDQADRTAVVQLMQKVYDSWMPPTFNEDSFWHMRRWENMGSLEGRVFDGGSSGALGAANQRIERGFHETAASHAPAGGSAAAAGAHTYQEQLYRRIADKLAGPAAMRWGQDALRASNGTASAQHAPAEAIVDNMVNAALALVTGALPSETNDIQAQLLANAASSLVDTDTAVLFQNKPAALDKILNNGSGGQWLTSLADLFSNGSGVLLSMQSAAASLLASLSSNQTKGVRELQKAGDARFRSALDQHLFPKSSGSSVNVPSTDGGPPTSTGNTGGGNALPVFDPDWEAYSGEYAGSDIPRWLLDIAPRKADAAAWLARQGSGSLATMDAADRVRIITGGMLTLAQGYASLARNADGTLSADNMLSAKAAIAETRVLLSGLITNLDDLGALTAHGPLELGSTATDTGYTYYNVVLGVFGRSLVDLYGLADDVLVPSDASQQNQTAKNLLNVQMAMGLVNDLFFRATGTTALQIDGYLINMYSDYAHASTVAAGVDGEDGDTPSTATIGGAVWRDPATGAYKYTGAGSGTVYFMGAAIPQSNLFSYTGTFAAPELAQIYQSAQEYRAFLAQNPADSTSRTRWYLNGFSSTQHPDNVYARATVSGVDVNAEVDYVRQIIIGQENQAVGLQAAGRQFFNAEATEGYKPGEAARISMSDLGWYSRIAVLEVPRRTIQGYELWRIDREASGVATFVRTVTDDEGNLISSVRYNEAGQFSTKMGDPIGPYGQGLTVVLGGPAGTYDLVTHQKLTQVNGKWGYYQAKLAVALTADPASALWTSLPDMNLSQEFIEVPAAQQQAHAGGTVTYTMGAPIMIDAAVQPVLTAIVQAARAIVNGAGSMDKPIGIAIGDVILTGGPGADLLLGAAGKDVLNGGSGDDDISGNEGNDTLSGGEGNDRLFGGAGNDSVDGGAGDDILLGEQGDDNLAGGAGNDMLSGGAGQDLLTGADGSDTLYGGLGDDKLFGGDGDNVLNGEDDNDTLVGGAGHDSITGGAGNDVILGDGEQGANGAPVPLSGGSSDTVWGGGGNDSILAGAGDDLVFGESGNDTLIGGDGNDTLVGGYGADTLDGGAGNDLLIAGNPEGEATGVSSVAGGAGTDVLVTKGGNVVLSGDADLDRYFASTPNFGRVTLADFEVGETFMVQNFNFPINEGISIVPTYGTIAGTNTTGTTITISFLFDDDGKAQTTPVPKQAVLLLPGRSPADIVWSIDSDSTLRFKRAGDPVNYGNNPTGYENLPFLVGTEFDDKLPGTAASDMVYGGDGFDVIDTGAGNDTVHGGGNGDQITAGAGADVLYGEGGDDVISGGLDNDSLDGGDGWDRLNGDEGDDTLAGGAGIDSLSGGAGNDILSGDEGDDRLGGDAGNDTLYGGVGNDILDGGYDNDMLYGGDGADTLSGSAGNDSLYGGAGDDTFDDSTGDDVADGGDGNDKIDLGFGNDSLRGGAGNDTLAGGTGDDTLDGGAGADVLRGQLTNAADADLGSDTVSYAMSPAAVSVNLSNGQATGGDAQGDDLGGIENLIGTAFDDNLVAKDGANAWSTAFDPVAYLAANPDLRAIYGSDTAQAAVHWNSTGYAEGRAGAMRVTGSVIDAGNGNDAVLGAAQDDYVLAGSGNDTVAGMGGNDYLYGEAGSDSLMGGAGNDLLSGGSGNDRLNGETGNDSLYGGAGDDAIFGDAEGAPYADSGAPSNDVLSGGDGNDTIEAGAGNDVVTGDAGNDIVYGGYGNDAIAGNDGDDNLMGDFGNDTLDGGAGNDTLNGGDQGDLLRGGGGNDTLSGGSGSDTLEGGAGADMLYGGLSATDGAEALDTVTYATASGGVYVNLSEGRGLNWEAEGDKLYGIENIVGSSYGDYLVGQDAINPGATRFDAQRYLDNNPDLKAAFGADLAAVTNQWWTTGVSEGRLFAMSVSGSQIEAGGGTDVVYGGAQDDYILGGDGDDTVLDGGGGNDFIYGQAGNDSMVGGFGDDRMYGDIGNDTMSGDAGNDTLDGGVGNDLLTGGDGSDSLAGGTGNDSLAGGDGNDTLFGQDGADTLDGGAGNDTAWGGNGDDTIGGGIGDDSIYGGDGNDNLLGGDGNDWIAGDSGNDTIGGGIGADNLQGGDGNDAIDGGDNNDSLFGGSGIDTLSGGLADDQLFGEAGDDVLNGGDGADTLKGGDGVDLLDGGAGNDQLYGDAGNDSLTGGAGDDALAGGDGSDTLWGGDGADWIEGGAGMDVLYGGAGNDTFNIDAFGQGLAGLPLNPVEVIKDFQAGDFLKVTQVTSIEKVAVTLSWKNLQTGEVVTAQPTPPAGGFNPWQVYQSRTDTVLQVGNTTTNSGTLFRIVLEGYAGNLTTVATGTNQTYQGQ
jgi:Ca2+-binding RTX toxin-like protein